MKYILILSFLFILNLNLIAQAKKPTLMIIPSKAWCDKNGYIKNFTNQGIDQVEADYEKAFLKNTDLKLVISKLNGLMAERGFPLKDLESSLASLKNISADNDIITSKNGSSVYESAFDKLREVAKADIIIELTWTVNQTGPFNSVSFNLRGIDSYTNKQIASAVGTGPDNAAANLSLLLETAVLSQIDNFNSTLQNYFDDLFVNGREITMRIRRFDSWDKDLETDFDGKELSEIIEDWLNKNSVKGRFNTTDATENILFFEQVRIPVYDINGRALDARNFCRGLQNYLKSPPYNIISKLTIRGLGDASLILGEK